MTIHLTATAATRVVRKRREVNRLRQKRWRRPTVRSSLLMMLPALLFLGVFSAYPLEELVRMSLSRVTPGNMLDVSWPFSGGENYRATLNDQGFPVVIRNTLILIVVSVGVTLALGVLAALILQRESRFSNGVHGIMIFMWALPPVVTGSVWKFLLSSSGPIPEALNSASGIRQYFLADPNLAIWSVTAVVCWVSVAFASLVMRAGLAQMDPHQIEAATVDGASRLQLFRFLMLPELRPVLLVQGLLTVLYSFKIFDFPFVISDGGPGNASTTLPYLAYKQSFGSLEFGVGSATAVFAMAVVIVVAITYLFLAREEDGQ